MSQPTNAVGQKKYRRIESIRICMGSSSMYNERRKRPSAVDKYSNMDGVQLKIQQVDLRVLVNVGLATLLLVFGARAVSGDGSLELGSLRNALTLLALLGLLCDLRGMVSVIIG